MNRSLARLDRRLLHLGRQWRLKGFPIPLAMRLRFKLGFISFEFTLLAGYTSPSADMEVIDVPTLTFESSDILKTIKPPSKGYEERAELRAALTNLQPDQIIRLTPDSGETMRKLKRMVTEAGKDIDKSVKHLEDGSGDLLVFIPAPRAEGAAKRGRPKKEQTEE